MNDFIALTGVTLVILALCFGISGCDYVKAKAKAIQIQNQILKRQTQ